MYPQPVNLDVEPRNQLRSGEVHRGLIVKHEVTAVVP